MSDLLKAAAESPLLLAFLVVGGFLVWAVEKLGSVDGPLTRLVRAWQERELRKLRRERAAATARRELRDDRVDDLESEVVYLRSLLDGRIPPRDRHPIPVPRRHDPATAPIPRARNSARARPPGR